MDCFVVTVFYVLVSLTLLILFWYLERSEFSTSFARTGDDQASSSRRATTLQSSKSARVVRIKENRRVFSL